MMWKSEGTKSFTVTIAKNNHKSITLLSRFLTGISRDSRNFTCIDEGMGGSTGRCAHQYKLYIAVGILGYEKVVLSLRFPACYNGGTLRGGICVKGTDQR